MFKRFRFIYAILIGVILAMLLVYVRLPYYVTKPGMAAKLEPYVQVEVERKNPVILCLLRFQWDQQMW